MTTKTVAQSESPGEARHPTPPAVLQKGLSKRQAPDLAGLLKLLRRRPEVDGIFVQC